MAKKATKVVQEPVAIQEGLNLQVDYKTQDVQPKKPKKEKVVVVREQRNWIDDRIAMLEEALEMANDFNDEVAIDRISRKLEDAKSHYADQWFIPEVDLFFYTIDVMEFFDLKDESQSPEALIYIKGQSHKFPQLRGKTLGGADWWFCMWIGEIYKEWAYRIVKEKGPQYLEEIE